MKIVVTEDKELADEIRRKLKENGGYCPCALEKSEDTKCMCQDFIENIKIWYWHWGLYKKI